MEQPEIVPASPISRIARFLSLILVLACVGALDYRTGYELRLGVLYAMMVGFGTWFLGLEVGVGVSVAAVGIEQWAEFAGGRVFTRSWIPYVNSVSRLTIYLFVAFSFFHFRRTIDLAKRQVQAFQGKLPVCGSCYRVEGGGGFWMDFPTYLRRNSGAEPEFHACPICEREGRSHSSSETRVGERE